MSDLTETEVYTRLIDHIKGAASCAHQLAHLRKDSRWLRVRDFLEEGRAKIIELAMRKAA